MKSSQPTHTMNPEQASAKQRIIVDELNPEHSRKHKAAINSSPAKRPIDTVVFPITDPHLLETIERLGLTTKMESLGKLEWQCHKGTDMLARLLGFIERHGRVYGQSNYAENSLAKRNEIKKEVAI